MIASQLPKNTIYGCSRIKWKNIKMIYGQVYINTITSKWATIVCKVANILWKAVPYTLFMLECEHIKHFCHHLIYRWEYVYAMCIVSAKEMDLKLTVRTKNEWERTKQYICKYFVCVKGKLVWMAKEVGTTYLAVSSREKIFSQIIEFYWLTPNLWSFLSPCLRDVIIWLLFQMFLDARLSVLICFSFYITSHNSFCRDVWTNWSMHRVYCISREKLFRVELLNTS